jgi:hypothetical protein
MVRPGGVRIPLVALLIAACSMPGIRQEGWDARLGGEIQAERSVVRERAEAWLGRNGYRLASAGSTLVAEKRAPSGRAGVEELVVLSVALEERAGGITYAQLVATPYLENGGRVRVERSALGRIDAGADVHALWDAISPRPGNPPG